ncbi:ABC transporter substrate-binding protein [Aeromicrobium sp. UC242_57]|uniref:ABC transporter substrate-binding protein n=1 Tax=Aeromicrobium sp. UC242_57 TaxID=3374624 RepID=UPI0037923AFD
MFYDITDATGLGAVSAAISQFTVGEKAAQDYLNDQGGIDGRPILIKTCDSKADPAATTACAQKAVQDKAVAKLGLSVAWGENGFPVLKKAGIPSLNPPVNPQDMKDGEDSFVMAGSSEYEAQVQYVAEDLAAKTIVVFTDENPSGQDHFNRVEAYVKTKGYDIKVTPVYLPGGTADPTPFVAKAVQLQARRGADQPKWRPGGVGLHGVLAAGLPGGQDLRTGWWRRLRELLRQGRRQDLERGNLQLRLHEPGQPRRSRGQDLP